MTEINNNFSNKLDQTQFDSPKNDSQLSNDNKTASKDDIQNTKDLIAQARDGVQSNDGKTKAEKLFELTRAREQEMMLAKIFLVKTLEAQLQIQAPKSMSPDEKITWLTEQVKERPASEQFSVLQEVNKMPGMDKIAGVRNVFMKILENVMFSKENDTLQQPGGLKAPPSFSGKSANSNPQNQPIEASERLSNRNIMA